MFNQAGFWKKELDVDAIELDLKVGGKIVLEYQRPSENFETLFNEGGYSFKFDKTSKGDVYRKVYNATQTDDNSSVNYKDYKSYVIDTPLSFEEVLDLPW